MPRTQVFSFNLGDKVEVTEIKRPGIVVSLLVNESGVQYQVVYWNDCARRTEWVYDHEIRLREEAPAT